MPPAPRMRNHHNEPLRVPQARVLMALMPRHPDDPPFDWPLITRTQLCIKVGYTTLSGSVTRALNGIKAHNKTSGDPHLGLIGKKMVEQVVVDVEGVSEINYRITPLGIRALKQFIASGKKIPKVKDASLCVNDRYLDGE